MCDTGYDVLLVQQAPVAQGVYVPTSGNFVPTTDAAVRGAYQEQFGLTLDGLVDRETLSTHLVPDAPGQGINRNGVVDPFGGTRSGCTSCRTTAAP